MGNQCGCADKGDTEQEVRADPVSHYSLKPRDYLATRASMVL